MFGSCRKMFIKETFVLVSSQTKRTFSTQPLYVQGQNLGAKIREYFYYIDHEGMVCIIYVVYYGLNGNGFINKTFVLTALPG